MDSKLKKNIDQYIQLVYAEKSPLSNIINLNERKSAACKKLGLDPASPEIKKIIDLQDETYRDLIIDYMCKNESNEVMDLMSNQHLFLEIQILKMTPLNTENADEEKILKAVNLKTTMSEKSEELLSRINASYLKIFKGQAEIAAAKKKVNWTTLEQRIKKRDEQKQALVQQNQQPISV